jgi:hypothetical protein
MTTAERNTNLITNAITNMEEDVIQIITSLSSINDKISRKKNNTTNYISSLYEGIPENLQKTLVCAYFFRYDSGYHDPERVGIFGSDFCNFYLQHGEIFLIDGPFRAAHMVSFI